MFEGMTDKGRYNREAPARIFHSSAGSNPNFQRKPHVEKPYKSKPKRQTPLNHLPKEFHGRPFSRNLYLTSRSQIFEKKKKKKSVLKKVRKTTMRERNEISTRGVENWQAYPAEARRPKSLALSRPPYSGTQWGTRGWLPLQKRFVRPINYRQSDN